MKILVALAVTAFPWVIWRVSRPVAAVVFGEDPENLEPLDLFLGGIMAFGALAIGSVFVLALVELWTWAL